MSGSRAATEPGVQPGGLPADASMQKLASKVQYAEEWALSLEQSHPDSVAREQAIEKHWADVGMIKEMLSNSCSFHCPQQEPANATGACGGGVLRVAAPSGAGVH